MGSLIELESADGHKLAAWKSEPLGTPRGGLIVIQEIFGLTDHIRRVTDGFADAGYLAIAPAMFDRVERNVALDYTDIGPGRDLMAQIDPEHIVLDLAAVNEALSGAGKRGAVGYCWGGSLADLCACRLDIDAAVSYYGASILSFGDGLPKCPVQYHFGALDAHIPMDLVDEIRAARPTGEFYVYEDAGHGFNCDDRDDYHEASAAQALERTLTFFAKHL